MTDIKITRRGTEFSAYHDQRRLFSKCFGQGNNKATKANALCNNIRKKVEEHTGRSWKITPERNRACKQKETKRKSDIWKKTSGQERDLYFLFSSPVLTRCDVPGVPVGPVSSCLHYSQNFPSPRLLPSDPEIWLAPGYNSSALWGMLELKWKELNWAAAAARENRTECKSELTHQREGVWSSLTVWLHVGLLP